MACFTAADSYFARFFWLLIDLPLALDVRRNLSRTSGGTATSSSSSSLSSLGDDDVAAEESAATLLVVIDVSNADADEEIVEMDGIGDS